MEPNLRQQTFIQEYLLDLNATRAALRSGYSPLSAHSIGSENLRKPEIQLYIQKKMEERSKRTNVRADDVLKELARIALTHTPPYLYRETRNTWEIYAYPMRDKIKAIELVGKHLGMFAGRGCSCIPAPDTDLQKYLLEVPPPKIKQTRANSSLREYWGQIMKVHYSELTDL